MSTERLKIKNLNHISNIREDKAEISKVDINHLLAKVRNKEKKERNENYIFVGLVCGVVAITGVIATL
ncbi:hypothetical protein OAJ75_03680 [Candidatus Pelagibacter sp.]|nr:hypothetical protein [Candidatus Pelagibacter sp.]